MACTPPPPGREYISEAELEALTGIPRKTWQAWRAAGRGPAYIKVGDGPKSPVRYPRARAVEWLMARERRSTSDPGPAEAESR